MPITQISLLNFVANKFLIYCKYVKLFKVELLTYKNISYNRKKSMKTKQL